MVDARNAFNLVCREEALRTADARCPSIATALRNVYGHASELCLDGLLSVARVAVTVEPPAAADEPAPADPRPEIERLLETYRRAIESRDLDRLRSAYPGMTADQEQAWRGFFSNVSALQATLEILELDISGDTARARMEATYEYRMNRSETQTFVFTASFRRGTDGWRMDQVQ